MFNQELKNRVASLEYAVADLRENYRDLYHKHYLLLAVLGIHEVSHPARTELVKKTDDAMLKARGGA